MHDKMLAISILILVAAPCVRSQTEPEHEKTVPLYRVNVVERTVNAVNYQYRSGPTQIDFRGTVLMPDAKGGAVVESKKGRTEIDAKFDHVVAPRRYGPEYLTYVLWAITPDGHARNLGEVLPDGSDKAHLRVTTGLQSFGLIVTAEPYSTVHQPSDVVVLENRIRPDTVGSIQPIEVKYDLLPRGQYTYNVPANMSAVESGPRVSMGRYEAIVAVYEAQNAVQIARAAGASDLAGDVFQKAQQQYQNAQDLERQKVDSKLVVTAARQAAETAEDARDIAVARKEKAELARAKEEAASERERRIAAEAAAQRAQAQAQADREQIVQQQAEAEANRTQLDEERAQAQAQAAAAATPPPAPPAAAPATESANTERDLRMRLFQQLRAASLPVLDTPRGIVVTVADADFRGASMTPATAQAVQEVASVIAARPGLVVEVDGNSDSPGDESERLSEARAQQVRDDLAQNGVPLSSLTARNLGASRPLGPNTSADARLQNRRVEIVISGAPIGGLAYWDKTYPIR